ncbi:hypothetical protein BJX76DRAFT_17485 [Aspergillus varians]
MSGFKGIMKEGWHPKGREGKKEGWRNDFKGVNQVAGWMGKGKDKDDDDAENHVSRPLSSLKDPSSFGPPPKHIKYHGAAALPNETTPDRTGWGAPLSQAQLDEQESQRRQAEEEAEEEKRQAEEAAKRPPVPYRANRTGIDPSTLPPPPVRRVGSVAESAPTSAKPTPKPSLPPRLPPRTNSSTPVSHSPSPPPPAYSPSPPVTNPLEGQLNQASVSRLSQAGVSVPAFGIGERPSNPTTPSTGYANEAPVNELQSRFSQMRTTSASSPSPAPPPPAQPTQSSATSTLNAANAKSAFNDFRSKHSDQIESGKQKLNGFNQKYGITNRINNAFDSKSTSAEQAPPIPPHPNLSRSTTASSTDTGSLAQRKAPPPPPPQKKAELRSSPVNTGSPAAPPPLPLGTKPR